MGVGASGATLEIQLVADVARLKRDMAAMQDTVASATASAGKSFAGMSAQTVNSAAQMAAAAQASARAAVGMAGGIKTATGSMQNANIVTMELFHVTRSLTEQLAMGVSPARAFGMEIGRIATAVQYSGGSIGGLIKQFATWAGIIKVTQNSELAEIAVQKTAIATSIQSRAERSLSALTARQAQVAIAQAQLAAATTAEEEAAGQTMLVKALRSVQAQSGQVVLAQQALTAAQAEAATASEEAAAASTVSLGSMGAALLSVTAVATPLVLAFIDVKREAEGDDAIRKYAETLGLTREEMKKLKDVTVTWGDVTKATWEVLLERAGLTSKGISSFFSSAFSTILDFGKFTISVLLGGFAALVELVASVGKNLARAMTGNFSAMTNPLADMKKQFFSTFNDVQAGFSHIASLSRANAEARVRQQANALIADRNPARSRSSRGTASGSDNGLAQSLAELDAAIKGQLRLAAAYLISDAAAIKATALQKAEEEAIRHKGDVGVFYEKELAKAVATGAAEGAKQVAHLRDETAARKAVNDNLAAGTLSYRDMNEAMQDETALQPLLVLQSIATGDAYKAVTAVIEAYRKALQGAHEEEHRSQALQELGRLNEQHKEAMTLLERESQLTGVSKDKRDEILKLLKQELDLRQQFPGMTEEEIQQIIAQTAAEDTLRKHLDEVEAGMDQLRQTGENMIDTVFNIDNWKDPLDLALQLVKQLEQSFVTLAFANPLKNKLYGENSPTLDDVGGVGGFFGSLVGGGKKASSAAGLSAAGTTLTSAGATLNSAAAIWQAVAAQLQAAALALQAAGATGGAGGGFGSLLGGLLGGGGAAGATTAAGFEASSLANAPFAYGLASGGAFKVGGRGGIDRNVLSINGKARARVSADEVIAVIPRDQLGAGANIPGMKHGGFLGALSFLSPLAFLTTRSHFNPLALLSPGLFLASKAFSGGGHNGPNNDNQGSGGGHTFNINVNAPNTGNAARDRQTSLQQAADIREAVAGAQRKGLA